uniref:Ser thr abc1 family n=1 Tax=Tetraselmis sp. GSL018 TaxID=582737 RepID=A0A061QZG1_9CHLO
MTDTVRTDKALRPLQEEKGMCVLTSRYSPDAIAAYTIQGPGDYLKCAARITDIATTLGTFFACLFLDKLRSLENDEAQVRVRAAQLRETLTNLGPSFIKAGQVLANRPDIVRQDFMEELCVLQDDVPAFPDSEAFAIMESDLGRPLAQVFSSISESPVAAASLGQVYKAKLRDTGEDVAVKVRRPGVEPLIYRDLYIFRRLAGYFNWFTVNRLGCNAQLIVDEFGEKLLEELDYGQEMRNIKEFYANFKGDPNVKIPWVREDLCGPQTLVMEWIDGIRCTDSAAIQQQLDVQRFIRVGVISGLRQLLEFGLFHGDPHPGNIFAMRDGRIAYVDFGNVAALSTANKQVLIDAVVHAVNEDYYNMAGDFVKLGFLGPGTDISPIVPALEKIWKDSMGKSMAVFNFRTVTSKFNELVYQYPIRIPERYSLVIRSLLTQEGICMTLDRNFHFLEVAYPYVARRLLTDEDPSLRERLIQVLFNNGQFQWERLRNLIRLAQDGSGSKLDLNDTLKDGLVLLLNDNKLRTQLLMAFTEDNRLHMDEVMELYRLVEGEVQPTELANSLISELPLLSRRAALSWSERVLAS